MSTDTPLDNMAQGTTPAAILDRVDEAVYALDSEWQFTYVNERAATIVDRDPATLLGASLWDEFPGVADSAAFDAFHDAVESQEPRRFELAYEPRGVWFTVRAYPSADGLTVCFHEVTAEREQELELQRSRRLFASVFAETNDAFVVADTDRRITDFNPAAEQLFGYDASEVIGEKSQLLYADTEAFEQQGDERYNDQAPQRRDRYVVEYERADGSTFKAETTGTPLKGRDDETFAFFVTIRDVTSQVEHERDIERRNRTLKQFHETTTDESAPFEAQVTAVLELAKEYLGLETGVLAETDGQTYIPNHVSAPEEAAGATTKRPLEATFCERIATTGEPFGFHDADEAGVADHPAVESWGIAAYLGSPVRVDGELYGTLSFASTDQRAEAFSESQETFVRIVAQWAGKELSRQRNRARADSERERLRQIIDMLPQLVFAKDESGTFLLANEAVAGAYGTTVDELEGATDADFADSEAEAEHFRADDRAVIDSGEPKRIPEEPLTTADEGERIFATKKIPYDPVDTAGSAVLGVSTDITERKQREADLEVQSAAMEVSMDGISILDGDEFTYMNEAHAAVFGYDADELIGSPWRRLYGDEEIDRIEAEVFPELGREGEWRGETVGRRRDGTSVDQEITLSLLDDGKLICTNRDITARKERQRDVRELTERLDLAVEGANLGVWDWDMTTDRVTFNDQWAAMLGLTLDDIEPSLETWEERVHPADMAHVEAALEAHIAGESELYDCEHRMRTATGEWKWVRDVGEVVDHDEDGQPVRAVGIHLDISHQKAFEKSLEEERDMFAQGPAVVFKWANEAGWPVEYVSENVTETFGYTPAELESGAVPYERLIHDDDVARVTAKVESQTDDETERFSHDPYRMVTADGEVRWVTDNTKFIRADGEVTHYLGYLVDITDRKRLEQSLRESERSLREVSEIAADTSRGFEEKLGAILELGRERLELPYGFLTRIDDGTQHIVEATGTHSELQAGASAPMSKAYCRRTIEQDDPLTIQNAVQEEWPDDAAYDAFGLGCYIGGKVVVDNDIYGTLCFADRDDRDHQFDESERAFVELLVQWTRYELASEAVETKLRRLNETAQRLLSAGDSSEVASIAVESAKEVLDLPMTGIWWYDDATDALVPAGMTAEVTALVGDQPTFEGGESLAWETFKTGEIAAYADLKQVSGRFNDETPMRSELMIPLGGHGILISGSTERRAFSETDRGLFEILAATVETALDRAEREQELRDTRERLEQSNQELEQFAYAASHDLQEPLRTVSSYLTLLERRNRDVLDEDALEFIDFAVDGADRMREMIQALLEYSRVDTRGQAFEPTEMDTVFRTVTQNLELTADERGATIDLPESPDRVVGDASQLVQLFQNLVENGIKYSEGDPHVDISVTRTDGDSIQYAVADDGIGMDPSQLTDIFEVFQRLHTREEFDGTGIGLSICRKIVDRHDGEIRVESSPGDGSTFFVTLPAAGVSHD